MKYLGHDLLLGLNEGSLISLLTASSKAFRGWQPLVPSQEEETAQLHLILNSTCAGQVSEHRFLTLRNLEYKTNLPHSTPHRIKGRITLVEFGSKQTRVTHVFQGATTSLRIALWRQEHIIITETERETFNPWPFFCLEWGRQTANEGSPFLFSSGRKNYTSPTCPPKKTQQQQQEQQ